MAKSGSTPIEFPAKAYLIAGLFAWALADCRLHQRADRPRRIGPHHRAGRHGVLARDQRPEPAVMASEAVTPDWGPERSRVVTWHDPGCSPGNYRRWTGWRRCRRCWPAPIPPPSIAAALGFTLDSVDPGRRGVHLHSGRVALQPAWHRARRRGLHLLDSAIGCAVQTTLPAGVGYTSLELKVNYLRPVHAGMALRAHGWVIKPGRRVAFAEGDVRDADDKVLATASGSCLIIS